MARKTKKEKEAEAKAASETPSETLAETSSTGAAPNTEAPAPAQSGPMLRILAQYTKDASFENPNAPGSLRSDQPAPAINIGIEIGRQMFDDDTVEVTLMLKAEATRAKDGREAETAFICELEYAGLFAFQNTTIEDIQPLILIECPRLLFPFARQIIAEMTQNGGFPPIMLEPPDFSAMFREEMLRRAAAQQGEPQGRA